MNKCHGIFGKLFGHSYLPAITRGAPSVNLGAMEGSGSAVIKVINSTRPETYHGIYCKRCGKVING